MMKIRRTDERKRKQLDEERSSRFSKTEEGWYFRTREGLTLGPYPTGFDAELSASLLITRLAQLEKGENPSIAIQQFVNDPANSLVKRVAHCVDLAELRRRRAKPAMRSVLSALLAIPGLTRVTKPDSD